MHMLTDYVLFDFANTVCYNLDVVLASHAHGWCLWFCWYLHVLDLIEDYVKDNDEELLDWISKFPESNTSLESCIRFYVILWCNPFDFREYMVFFLLDLASFLNFFGGLLSYSCLVLDGCKFCCPLCLCPMLRCMDASFFFIHAVVYTQIKRVSI